MGDGASADLVDDDDDEPSDSDDDEEISGSLYFQERAFRDFLKEHDTTSGGVAIPHFEAHLMVLATLTDSLCAPPRSENDKADALQHYAACFWDWHFLQMETEKATKEQVGRVLTLLSRVFRDENGALKKIEQSSRYYENNFDDEMQSVIRKQALDGVQAWVQRASAMEGILDVEVRRWIQDFAVPPNALALALSKFHAQSWCKADEMYSAMSAFEYALGTLRMVSSYSLIKSVAD